MPNQEFRELRNFINEFQPNLPGEERVVRVAAEDVVRADVVQWARQVRFVGKGMKTKTETPPATEEIFDLILTGIKEVYDVEGVIAGGAVRDLAAKAPRTKDIDVFLPMPVDAFAEHVAQLGWSGHFSVAGNVDTYGRKNNTNLPVGFDAVGRASHNVKGHIVDLVFLAEPLSPENVATFPVHAQRGVWTLQNKLQMSPEMTKDIMEKSFTIDPTIKNKVKLKSVLAKINGWKQREHYREWKIVEPDIPEWWEAKQETEEEQKKKEESDKWWVQTTTPNYAEVYEKADWQYKALDAMIAPMNKLWKPQ